MRLHVKCNPKYFKMLDIKGSEFRQLENIIIEDQESGEKRVFDIIDIRKVDSKSREVIQSTYPLVDWDPDRDIYAIDLGDELDMNEIISVTDPAHPVTSKLDRNFEIPESEKTWYGVGESNE